MLGETVLYLLIIGLCSLITTDKRYDGVLSFAVMAFCAVIFGLFLMDQKTAAEAVLSFSLNESYSTNVKIDIVSSKQNYLMIYPFFIATLFALANNVIFKYESQKKHKATLFVFNLLSFVMLISSNNFIEIITFVFVIDILSQLLIKDFTAGRRYSIYNYVADMGLFLVLAMMQSKLTNLDIGNISRYYETGRHRDFIVFVCMAALAVKFGFFLFQGYWLDLKSAKFHNLYFLPSLSTPMAALVLLIKLYPILVVSPSFLPLLNIMIALTILWGSIGSFLNIEIKEKFVYFNMINIALFVKLLEQNDFIWNISCSNIVILLFLFNLCLYYLHDEIDRTHSQKTPATYLMPAGFGAVIYALMTNMTHLVKPENIYFLYAFLVYFVTVLAFSTAQVWYTIKNKAVNRRINYTALLIPLVIVLAALFSQNQGVSDAPIWLICAVGVFVFCLIPASVLRSLSLLNNKVHDVDLFRLFYQKVLAESLRHAGVFFNILMDFIFLEKTLLPLLTTFNHGLIQAYRKINRRILPYDILCVAVGIIIFLFLCLR